MSLENQLRIFVEGKTDVKFISDLISYRFNTILPDNVFVQTGGWTRLYEPQNVNQFQRMQDEDGTSLVIFDADNDILERKRELFIGVIAKKINITKENIFLFPNDYKKGDLESLLLSVANTTSHQLFFNCFDNYLACLGKYNEIIENNNLNIPDKKTYVYAYLNAHRQEVKEEKRDYKNLTYWNLDHSELDPLVNFLQPFFI